ncbi:hypothetical protein BDZ88DRAFT_475945 [Geranomyces variabilis]|nr:hypothetical protein BDZ88DRAFT_475945 [Geranomyces variabilis]
MLDALVPAEATSLLENVFETLEKLKVGDREKWISEKDVPAKPIRADAMAVVKQTLPAYCRAFTRDMNPLHDVTTLEAEHLNTLIHPIFRECAHRFGQTIWKCGEISSEFFIKPFVDDTNLDDLMLTFLSGNTKRLSQGDEELTENTAKARKKSTRASEKVDDILNSDVWNLVPKSKDSTDILKEVARFFKSGQGVEVIDLRTSCPSDLLKLSSDQAERYAAFVEQRVANPLSETSHDVLETLFNKLQSAKVSEWERIGEEGEAREDEDTKKPFAVIRTTLPAFSRAFA